MSKKVSSNTHGSKTRERVAVPVSRRLQGRAKRRAEARKAMTAERKKRIAERIKANPRLVRA